MDKINFPYRSNTHLQLLHVIAESGSWAKYGLDVDYDKKISSGRAHEAVLAGDIEFVGGNHVTTYGRRARGDKWVYIGQTVNTVAGRKLVVRADSGINGVADLRHKKVGSRGSHPQLNDWLQLKQLGLDVDRDDVEIIGQYGGAHKDAVDSPKGQDEEEGAAPLTDWVRDRKVDAAFVQSPTPFLVENDKTLKLIDVPELPMIYFTTLSTSLQFIENHPDIVERFLKGVIEGIHFFKTQPEKAAQIIKERYDKSGKLNDAQARAAQACLAEVLEPKLYPTPAAIANVYQEGLRLDKDAARINPMALWDLHFIRTIDDTGFVDDLYKGALAAAR